MISSINYIDFSFRSIRNKVYLRIQDTSKNIRDFLNSLELIFGFGFTCQPITYKKNIPTTIFQNSDIKKLTKLKIIGAVISEDLVCRMDFASKQGIDTGKIKILENLKYEISSATYELVYDGIRGHVTFSASGLVKIGGQLSPKILGLIEDDLENHI